MSSNKSVNTRQRLFIKRNAWPHKILSKEKKLIKKRNIKKTQTRIRVPFCTSVIDTFYSARYFKTRSAYTKFTGSVLFQSYRMSVSNRDSNNRTQRLIASNSSSSSLSSLRRSPVPERSGLMIEYAQREQREMREREERGNREGMERELKERRERETRVREDRTAEKSFPLQETPLCQCEHYQRRCSVKFPCCGVFYPCQHCHNLSGTCSANDRKAHHATHVKCDNCGLEEEVSMSCILGTYSYQSCLEEQNYENPVGWFIFVT